MEVLFKAGYRMRLKCFAKVSNQQVHLIQQPLLVFFKPPFKVHTHKNTKYARVLMTWREKKKIHYCDDGHDLELQLTERILNKWEDVRTYSFQANPHPDLQITQQQNTA